MDLSYYKLSAYYACSSRGCGALWIIEAFIESEVYFKLYVCSIKSMFMLFKATKILSVLACDS